MQFINTQTQHRIIVTFTYDVSTTLQDIINMAKRILAVFCFELELF